MAINKNLNFTNESNFFSFFCVLKQIGKDKMKRFEGYLMVDRGLSKVTAGGYWTHSQYFFKANEEIYSTLSTNQRTHWLDVR